MPVIHLAAPYKEKDVRKLRIGDTVYISGVINTLRDMGYRRALDLLDQGLPLPIDLSEGAVWHCGPVVSRSGDGWRIVSAGSTTSSRMTGLAASLTEKLDIRITIGKGTMGRAAADTAAKVGSCYLSTTGGCAALYTQQIVRVVGVEWLDLGYPEALWTLDVADFGPLTVGIDCQGDILYDRIKKDCEAGLDRAYATCGIPPSKAYAFWPRRVPGGVPRSSR